MATVSRRLLFVAGVFLLIAGIGLKIASGGSTLLIAASGFGLIVIVFAWSLFDGPSDQSHSKGSTPTKANYSVGKGLQNFEPEREEQALPDPLESGFEIPLM